MNQNQNNQQRQWAPVQGGGDKGIRWEPHKIEPFNASNPNNFLQGYYKDLIELVGPEGPFHVVQVQALNQDGSLGDIFDVSGGKVLIDLMQKITMGSYIGIKYAGKVKSKSGGRSYNMWETFVDTNAIPYSQMAGAAPQKASPPVQSAPPVQQHVQPQVAAPVFINPPLQQIAQTPVFNTAQAAQAAGFTPPAQQAAAPASPVNTGGQGAPAAPVFQNPFANTNGDDGLPF